MHACCGEGVHSCCILYIVDGGEGVGVLVAVVLLVVFFALGTGIGGIHCVNGGSDVAGRGRGGGGFGWRVVLGGWCWVVVGGG